MTNILAAYPQFFQSILENPDSLGVQVIYSKIDRRKNQRPVFTDYYFNVDTEKYFYPASTIKLPIAALALQKINELNIPGLDKNSTMITGKDHPSQTEVFNDPTSPDGRPTIAHYIKKILLVSDNDAYNRLYEFLGQEYINHSLHRMGYSDIQILHRLEIALTGEENRLTNPVSFYDTANRIVYNKPAEKSRLVYTPRNTRMGKGFFRRGELVNEPFDFSAKNRMSLPDLHQVLRSLLFPEAVEKEQRFNLGDDDYSFLRKYLSMHPRESISPVYDPAVPDDHVRFLFYGQEGQPALEGLRIFNKVGDAYGFLVDAAYFADFKNNIEFMLSAVIHCNSDGIYNDDHYDYRTTGFPFLKNLGRVIYEHELKRQRDHSPDLSRFRFNYLIP